MFKDPHNIIDIFHDHGTNPHGGMMLWCIKQFILNIEVSLSTPWVHHEGCIIVISIWLYPSWLLEGLTRYGRVQDLRWSKWDKPKDAKQYWTNELCLSVLTSYSVWSTRIPTSKVFIVKSIVWLVNTTHQLSNVMFVFIYRVFSWL